MGFQSFDLIGSSRKQKNSLELELSFPITLGTGGSTNFSLVPGYRRTLRILRQESGLGNYGSDLETYFYRIGSQDYIFTRYPFAELYNPEAEIYFQEKSISLEEAFYTPEAFISMSRSFSSRISDLFLPSYIELSLDKEFKKEGDLTDFFNNYRFTAQANALNLFGAFGAYPLFPFYRTDEFSTALTLSVSADRAVVRKSDILLEHYISLEGERGNTFTLENRLHLLYDDNEKWTDRVSLLYLWYSYPEQGISLPFFSREIGKSGFWAHLESFELEMSGEKDRLSTHPLNLMLRHETSIILPEHGFIKAEISLGLDQESLLSGENFWRLGFRGGIIAKIEF